MAEDPLVRLVTLEKLRLVALLEASACRFTTKPLLLVTPRLAVTALPYPTITLERAMLLVASAPAACP